MAADSKKVQSIFHDAVEHHAAADWPAFLDGACGDDVELRHAVEALLRGHQQANSRLDEPAAASPSPASGEGSRVRGYPTADDMNTLLHGAVVGPYKLIEPIGEGGMGSVWMAQQQEPV